MNVTRLAYALARAQNIGLNDKISEGELRSNGYIGMAHIAINMILDEIHERETIMTEESNKLGGVSPFMLDMALNALGVPYEKRDQVKAQLPTIEHAVSAINNAQTVVQDANALVVRAQPLIEVLLADWKKAGPAVQIVISAARSQGSFGAILEDFGKRLAAHYSK